MLCIVLWYFTNQHSVIDEASRHKKNIQPVPVVFSKYEGFNDLKRKKLKSQPLKSIDLKTHAEAIYNLLLKPFVNSSPEWKTESDNFKLCKLYDVLQPVFRRTAESNNIISCFDTSCTHYRITCNG